MFDIEYKGGNTVVISSKKTKVVINPKLSELGLKDVNVKDAVIVLTEPEFGVVSEDAQLVIDGPGEYEISDVAIRGLAVDGHDSEKGSRSSTIYRLEVGEARIAVIGNTIAELSEPQLETIGIVDMIILPVGGGGTLNPTEAAQLVRTIDARVVIPVHYADAALAYAQPQEEVAVFVKEFGGEVEQHSKYKVKSGAAIPQGKTVIELTRS